MKGWELFAVIGFFLMVIGAMLLMYSGSLVDSQELYRVSQSGGSLIDELSFMFPMLFGASVLGMGVGCLVCAYPIYKLEEDKAKKE